MRDGGRVPQLLLQRGRTHQVGKQERHQTDPVPALKLLDAGAMFVGYRQGHT